MSAGCRRRCLPTSLLASSPQGVVVLLDAHEDEIDEQRAENAAYEPGGDVAASDAAERERNAEEPAHECHLNAGHGAQDGRRRGPHVTRPVVGKMVYFATP